MEFQTKKWNKKSSFRWVKKLRYVYGHLKNTVIQCDIQLTYLRIKKTNIIFRQIQ